MATKNISNLHSTSLSKKSSDSFWKTKTGFYFLWTLYLAHSPSYELARRHNAGKLTDQDKGKLPADFDKVLAVYDDFGDVLHQDFRTWWTGKGIELCAIEGRKPRVSKVTPLKNSIDGPKVASDNVARYMEKNWDAEGRQNTILVAIPIGLSKKRITTQVNAILDTYSKGLKEIKYPKPKYSLSGKRQSRDVLFRYLYVLSSRAANRRKALWRVGAITKVSPKYSAQLDPNAKIPRKEEMIVKSRLAILTSRAYNRGLAISENAARGEFPNHTACPNAVEPNLHEMNRRFKFIVKRLQK